MKRDKKQIKKRKFQEVWAPALVSFADWVLKEALSLNIHKLYFLARDAKMAYMIACRMTETESLPLSCRYLEGSRYAWRMAEFALPDTDPMEKICMGGVNVTLRKILKRGGLDDREAEEVAKRLGKQAELDHTLSYVEIQRMKPLLAKCGTFQKRMKEHAKEAYDSTVRYLEQEGVMEQEPFAIVDSGWIGSLQMTLEHLRASVTGSQSNPIHGFYFGLYELPRGAALETYHTYYFRPYQDIEKKVRFNNCLFEAVCSAGEGMTAGYREEDGRMMPVYETVHNPNRERIIRNERCLEKLLAKPDTIKSLTQPCKEVRRRLERLMSMPDGDDIAEYGGYLFSDDVNDGSLQPVAAVLNHEEIRRFHVFNRLLLMKGMKKEDFRDSAWPEGSAVRAGRYVGYHLFQIRMYKRLVYIKKKLKNPAKL